MALPNIDSSAAKEPIVACYKAPPIPDVELDDNVERATTLTLLREMEKLAKSKQGLLHNAKRAAQKYWFKSQHERGGKKRNMAAKGVGAGVGVGSSVAIVASGGLAIPVVIVIAAGALVFKAGVNQAVQSHVHAEEKRKYIGPDFKINHEKIKVEAFMNDAIEHFFQANAALAEINKIFASEGQQSQAPDLVETYAHFCHELSKAAYYLEPLLGLSINFYEKIGLETNGEVNERGIVPKGKKARDQLLFTLRASHTRSHISGKELKPKENDDKLLSEYGLDNSNLANCHCPEDIFGPQDSLQEISGIHHSLSKLSQLLSQRNPADPSDPKEVENVLVGEDKKKAQLLAKKFEAKFGDLADPKIKVQLAHNLEKKWINTTWKQKGIAAIDALVNISTKPAELIPGASTAISKGLSKAFEKAGKKLGWLDRVHLKDQKEESGRKSAREYELEDLRVLSKELMDSASGALEHLKFAREALFSLERQVSFGAYELFANSERDPDFFHLLTIGKSLNNNPAISSANQSEPIGYVEAEAFNNPAAAAFNYYDFVYHADKTINYTYLGALFKCLIADGIKDLYLINEKLFPKIICQLAKKTGH